VISGNEDKPLRCLTWAQGRLFGASLTGDIVELDILRLRIKHSCQSHGGAVWAMEANPANPTILAAACEDGRVRIFTIKETGVIFARSCEGTKHGERLLSLCWHREGEVLFCGGADSQIRCVAAKSGGTLFIMTVENYGQEHTLVWSVRVLSDFTVISGDSLGHVQIWDGGIGTLQQSFAMHEADVLSIQVSSDEQRIYATGIDSKIVQFARVSAESSSTSSSSTVSVSAMGQNSNKWVASRSRRYHTHDLLSLAVVKDSEGTELLVGGGVDTQLSYMKTKDFGEPKGKVHKFLPFRSNALCCATKSRLIACTQHKVVNIWGLGRVKTNNTTNDHDAFATLKDHTQLDLSQGHRHIFKIKVDTRDDGNIACSALANNGKWFACCSVSTGLNLFRLFHVHARGRSQDDDFKTTQTAESDESDSDGEDEYGHPTPRVKRVQVPANVIGPGVHIHKLLFSHDSAQLLVITSDCRIVVIGVLIRPSSYFKLGTGRGAGDGYESASTEEDYTGIDEDGQGAILKASSVDGPRLRQLHVIDACLKTDLQSESKSRLLTRIKFAAWSRDGKWIAVVHSNNAIVVHPHPRKNKEGAVVILPVQQSPVTTITFQPATSPTILAIAHASNEVTLFNVGNCKYTAWSRAWQKQKLPVLLRKELHGIMGLTYNWNTENSSDKSICVNELPDDGDIDGIENGDSEKSTTVSPSKRNKKSANTIKRVQDLQSPASNASAISNSNLSSRRPLLIAYGTDAVFFVNDDVMPPKTKGKNSSEDMTKGNVSKAKRGRRKRKQSQQLKESDIKHDNIVNVNTKDGRRAFKRSRKFKPAMFMQFIGPNELVVVQVPWARVSKQFVLPMHRKRYGT
jgi:WD40 repeat protein